MHPRYRMILRSLFAGVLQSDLSAADLRVLIVELRRGRLADELAHMIEQANSHFDQPKRAPGPNEEIRMAEHWVKEKRISKVELTNIIRSINPEMLFNPKVSIRELLTDFFESSTLRQGSKLIGILQAAGGSDPFLKGISER